MPRVSVLMPTWNAMPFLPEAVKSILAQTYRDFEFIIVDDCSTDGTSSYLSTVVDPRVVVMRNDQNLGCTKSLNVGLARCCGEVICRMDADDVAFPDRIEKQIATFDDECDLVCCGGWMRNIGDSNEDTQVPLDDADIRDFMLFSPPVMHPTACFRRVLPSGDAVFYDESYPVAQDAELWFRLSAAGKMKNIPEYVVERRKHGKSVSSKRQGEQREAASKIARMVLERDFGIAATERELAYVQEPARNHSIEEARFLDKILLLRKSSKLLQDRYGSEIFNFWKEKLRSDFGLFAKLALRHPMLFARRAALPWISWKCGGRKNGRA